MCKNGTCTECRIQVARDSSLSIRYVPDKSVNSSDGDGVQTNHLDMRYVKHLLEIANEERVSGGKNKEVE